MATATAADPTQAAQAQQQVPPQAEPTQPTSGPGAPDPTEPGVDIPNLQDQYTRKVPKQAMGLRLAHQAMCLHDLQQVLNMDRAIINAQHVATLGDIAGAAQSATGEDMGIHVGDIVVNNPTPPPAATPAAPAAVATAPVAPAAAAPAAVPAGLSTLAKAGIAAALLGSGAALPLAGSAIANWFKSTPAAAAPTATVPSDPGGWQLQVVPPDTTTATP